jgi:aromatic-L-amino-acid decarboxylase
MTPEEFRQRGREVVDWIADYMERVEELPVASRVSPGEILARLPELPPEQGEPFADLMRDLDEIVLPGITHWQSPSWFGYFPANTSGPSILGDLLSSGLGVQGMIWQTSPACTELEMRVLDWLAGIELRALRPAGRARAGDRLRREPPGLRPLAGGLHLQPGALLDREGSAGRRDRRREPASDRRR